MTKPKGGGGTHPLHEYHEGILRSNRTHLSIMRRRLTEVQEDIKRTNQSIRATLKWLKEHPRD